MFELVVVVAFAMALSFIFMGWAINRAQHRQADLRAQAYRALDRNADKGTMRSLAGQLGAFRDGESQELVRRLMDKAA